MRFPLFVLKVIGLGAVAASVAMAQQPKSEGPSRLRMEAMRQLPFHDGGLMAAGLREPVEVIRDTWGVPHIYAQNTHDLFFAQGFVAAQDHMWQMEIWRRSNEGRLAEVLGKKYVERDKFARLLKFHGDWGKEMLKYHPDGPEIFAAFAEGVNTAINVAIEQGKVPVEFQMLKFLPSPSWTAQTVLSRVPAWTMSRNANSELARAIAIKSMGAAKAEELFPTSPHKNLEIPPGLDLNALSPHALEMAKGTGTSSYKLIPGPLSPAGPGAGSVSPNTLPMQEKHTEAEIAAMGLQDLYDITKTFDMGSNNWVIGGKKSATGMPILANDPHREVENPALRSFVHLVAPGWDVIGATEPGLPGISFGHNEDIAWGLTILNVDQQDLYVEETDPKNPDLYLYKGKWLPMEHDHQIIQVSGQRGKPEFYTAKRTVHGPVVYEDPEHHTAYSLRWVGDEPGGAGYLGSLNVMQAKNWDEFTKGVEKSWYLPSHSLVYADTKGNYGYMAAALSPIRSNWDGLLPVPGKDGKYEWAGFVPMEKMPRELNAPRGYYASANNDVISKLFPKEKQEFGFEYGASYRFDRINEVLSQQKKFSVDDMEKLQSDVTSLPARELVPLLAGLQSADADTALGLKQMAGWDKVLDKNSIAPSVYEAWVMMLTPKVYALHLPADQQKVFARYDIRSVIAWLQTYKKTSRKDCDALLLSAMGEAVAWLKSNYGSDSATWTWGNIHQARFEHPLLADSTKDLFAIPPVPRGGDAYTVQASSSLSNTNHDEVHGATAMMVLDTSNWDQSVGLNAPGNESAPGSPHATDLAKAWGDAQYFPLAFSRKKVDEVTKNKLMLFPASKDEGSSAGLPFERVQQSTFADISAVDISWGDYDNDGWPDLLVSYVSGMLKLYHNDHGKFVDVTASSGLMNYSHRMTAASWGDFDGDGKLDLYIGYAYSPSVPNRLYHNDGNGHFTDVAEKWGLKDWGETRQSSFIDFNNDGKVDLYIGFRDRPNRLYRNDGDHFTEVSEQMGIKEFRSTVGSIWFDYNGDGKLDLIEANQSGALNAVYRNDGDHFTEVAKELHLDGAPKSSEMGSVGLAIADYDNDGNFDIFFANYGPSWLMHNDGKGHFTDVAPQMGMTIDAHVVTAGWGDYDNDGLPDLYTDGYLSGHEHQEDFLFHNEGGKFRDVLPPLMARHDADHAVMWVDYDRDGAVDLALADHETAGTFSLYHNTLPPEQAHRSLEVFVTDARGHFTKAGSEVRIYKHGTREVLGGRLVDTGSGYNSQSVIPVHFGLGTWTGLVDVEVASMSNSGRKITAVTGVQPSEYIGRPLMVKIPDEGQ